MSVDCGDKSLLMAYLYGECDAAERAAFEQHLAACDACSREVRELGSMRSALHEWVPPDVALNFRIVSEPATSTPVAPFTPVRARQRWTRVPAWAQLAAAVMVLAVGAAIANLDVRFGNGGVAVRTGWQRAEPAASGNAGGQPWRADLAALERNLRRELATPGSSPTVTATASNAAANAAAPLMSPGATGAGLTPSETADLARRMQTLIEASERRQQQVFENLLATRLVQFARDVDSQRRSDLVRIQQGLGQVDTRTMSEIAQMREMQRLLIGRVANIQEIK